MVDLTQLHEAILRGDAKKAVAVTKEALAENASPTELVSKHMIPAMDEVGRRFECQEYFVPELLLSARAMKGALELIRPLLVEQGVTSAGRVIIGTVKGDLHDIGKNLVASMLAPGRIVTEILERKPNIVALSALLTTTMPFMKSTIEELKKAGVREQVKVMVGGAPVTQQYADQIGADGYSDNANGAVAIARRLSGV
jgi:5-methyltetrahydrofolate--homocysteine methyltransferase